MEGDKQIDVLVVDDDEAFSSVIARNLAAEGWAVRCAGTGADALAQCETRTPDIVVLDVMLPDTSGLQLCATLQQLAVCPGIVMLTARGSEDDILSGFDFGADDYLVKPCRPRELVARVRAVGRRLGRRGERDPRVAAQASFHALNGQLRLEPAHHRAVVGEQVLRLTPTEFALLLLLARHPGRVFERLELLHEVWATDCAGYVRNVDCHVTRIRQKVRAAGVMQSPIVTVHGIGYRLGGDEIEAP